MDFTGTVREYYDYDASGQLHQLLRAQSTRSRDGTITGPADHDHAVLQSYYDHDLLGRLTHQADFLADGTTVAYDRSGSETTAGVAIVYDNAGRITKEFDLVKHGTGSVGTRVINDYGSVAGGTYALGALLSSTATAYDSGQETSTAVTTNTLAWYDAARTTRTVIATDYTASSQTDTSYATDYTYAANGAPVTATIADGRPRQVTYRSDALGQVTRRDEQGRSGSVYANSANGDPHSLWYRFDGRQIGAVGNNGSNDVDYADSIETRMATPGQGAFAGGAASGVAFARFGQVADVVSSFQQGAAGGTYTANAGDTLSSIALQVWGDAGLWYKLAQANGYSDDAGLAEGQTITIPGGVLHTANSASTFKPYDPSDALGDTSPTTPKPQAAAKKKGCGLLGAILLVVIAVAATIVTTGAALAVASGTSFGTGLGAAVGVGASLGAVGTGAGVLGAIAAVTVGAALGSVVAQGIGIAVGLQDKFSWKGVGIAALTAFLGPVPVGKVAGSPFLGSVIGHGLTSAAVQGVALATGLQSKFDWAGVAAAGVGGGIGSAVAGSKFASSLGGFGGRLAANAASGLANAATRSLVSGTDFGDNLIAALPDVIGNTVGGFIEERIAAGEMSAVERASLAKEKAGARADDAPQLTIDPAVFNDDTLTNRGVSYGSDLMVPGFPVQLASNDPIAIPTEGRVKRVTPGTVAEVDGLIRQAQETYAKTGLTQDGINTFVALRRARIEIQAQDAGKSVDDFLATYDPLPVAVSFEKVAEYLSEHFATGDLVSKVAYIQTIAIDGPGLKPEFDFLHPIDSTKALASYGAQLIFHNTYTAAVGQAAKGLVDKAHVAELVANGVKFTPDALLATGRNSAGQVVFLESGNARAGLQHIVEQHGADFAKIGVPEADIPTVVMRAVTEGKVVGYQGRDQGRAIYEILLHQQNQRIAVSVGNNGFIVGANPAGRVP